MATSPHLKFTYGDYLQLPDDGRRHELVDGDHLETPAPTPKHQRIALNLATALRNHLRTHPLGEVYIAPCDVLLSDVDVVQPDLLYMASRHASQITTSHIKGAPDLVVEILSEKTRTVDEGLKRKLYERAGVPEYWVVDPDLESLTIYRGVDQVYTRVAELSLEHGDILTSPLFPDLEIPLSEIFT